MKITRKGFTSQHELNVCMGDWCFCPPRIARRKENVRHENQLYRWVIPIKITYVLPRNVEARKIKPRPSTKGEEGQKEGGV